MKFNLFVPTEIVSGEECVKANREKLCLGRSCFIVTGRHGAKASGALDDILTVLADYNIKYEIFDKITENPPIMTCYEGGKRCAELGADFVIGIGGGSALDACKAIAAYAANPGIGPEEIFDASKLTAHSLPIVAVPTTAGTGSEANPYSVLTLVDGERKRSFSSPMSWPKVSFVDPRYISSLGYNYTVSCALDAFAHAIESYLSPKSTAFSEMLALFAARSIWSVIGSEKKEFSAKDRECLMYGSSAAGVAISSTGTGFPHPLGYSMTLLRGVPHGKACAVFEWAYIEYNMKTEEGRAKIDILCRELSVTPCELGKKLYELADVEIKVDDEEIKKYISLVRDAKNYSNSPYVINEDEMFDILKKSLGGNYFKGNC